MEFEEQITWINDIKIVISYWDFAGQERWRSLQSELFKGSDAALLLFDLTRPLTLEHPEEWVYLCRKENPGLPIMLVGTKSDLEESVTVDDAFPLKYKEKLNLFEYFKVSAKSGDNVENIFNTIINEGYKYHLTRVSEARAVEIGEGAYKGDITVSSGEIKPSDAEMRRRKVKAKELRSNARKYIKRLPLVYEEITFIDIILRTQLNLEEVRELVEEMILKGELKARIRKNTVIFEPRIVGYNEKQIKEKIKKIISVSRRLDLEMMRMALRLDKPTFYDRIFEWAKEYKFEIDKDQIITDKAE